MVSEDANMVTDSPTLWLFSVGNIHGSLLAGVHAYQKYEKGKSGTRYINYRRIRGSCKG